MKNTHIWLGTYIAQRLARNKKRTLESPTHIIFCAADHFEPRWGNVDTQKEIKRVKEWLKKHFLLFINHRDYNDRAPKHTFFYPIDEYTPEVFKRITEFCENGLGEMEIQLHHDNDNPGSLRQKLERGKSIFDGCGMLARDPDNRLRYGFVHGNWALDNSRRDGRFCGVNNELEILSETGCYADFTLPSAPSDTQTRKINRIYYASDTPRPKSHNTGIDAEVGRAPNGGLMIIQGPLALNWKRRKFGFLPHIENGELTLNNPPIPERVDLWIEQAICVKGRPEWIFVKVHTHGAQEKSLTDAYFKNLDTMYSYLEERYNDGVNYKLNYVTAREMFNIIKAAEDGRKGEPCEYRDYQLRKC